MDIPLGGTLGFHETFEDAMTVAQEAMRVRGCEHYVYWLEPIERYYVVPRPSLSIWLCPGVFVQNATPVACTLAAWTVWLVSDGGE